jgi:hypothetical protein
MAGYAFTGYPIDAAVSRRDAEIKQNKLQQWCAPGRKGKYPLLQERTASAIFLCLE